jgi:hypothetical protein
MMVRNIVVVLSSAVILLHCKGNHDRFEWAPLASSLVYSTKVLTHHRGRTSTCSTIPLTTAFENAFIKSVQRATEMDASHIMKYPNVFGCKIAT